MNQKFLIIFTVGLVASAVVSCKAQDYDDEGFGNQGGQGDNENYGGNSQGYGNDDGYSANAPQYQQNVDADSSNSNPSGYSSSPQGGSDADGDYEGDDSSAAASVQTPTFARLKRSIEVTPRESAVVSATSGPIKSRVKRHSKYIGPVYTYVKTDKHANFKWGVKHKVGKKHYG